MKQINDYNLDKTQFLLDENLNVIKKFKRKSIYAAIHKVHGNILDMNTIKDKALRLKVWNSGDYHIRSIWTLVEIE